MEFLESKHEKKSFVITTIITVLILIFCFTSLYLLNKANKSYIRFNKIATTAIGLASIPVIIHPIDHFCHQVMDKTVRPVLGLEPHLKKITD